MTDQFPTVRTRRADLLTVLWTLLAAPQTLMVLVGCLALALVLGSLVPQIPPQAKDDPQAWLAVQPGLSAGELWFVRAAVLYDLYHTFWFRALVVLTGLVLSVRFVDSGELALRVVGRGRWAMPSVSRWLSSLPPARLPTWQLPEGGLASLREFLQERGYRWRAFPKGPPSAYLAVRREFLLWARPIGYGALLLALAGLAVLDSTGWQTEDWQMAVGETRAVGHDTPLAVRLDRFALEWESDRRLGGYQGVITWLDGERILGPARVGMGKPSTRQGIAVRLTGYVPAVKIRGRDVAGRALIFQKPEDVVGMPGEVMVIFPTPESQPVLFLPAEDLLLALTFDPLRAGIKPSLTLAISSGKPADDQISEVLYRSGQVSLGELQLEVDLSYRPILRVDYRPGMGLILVGMTLAIAALSVAWLTPTGTLWILVPQHESGPDGQRPARGHERPSIAYVLTPPRAERTGWWHRLVEELREVRANGD